MSVVRMLTVWLKAVSFCVSGVLYTTHQSLVQMTDNGDLIKT